MPKQFISGSNILSSPHTRSKSLHISSKNANIIKIDSDLDNRVAPCSQKETGNFAKSPENVSIPGAKGPSGPQTTTSLYEPQIKPFCDRKELNLEFLSTLTASQSRKYNSMPIAANTLPSKQKSRWKNKDNDTQDAAWNYSVSPKFDRKRELALSQKLKGLNAPQHLVLLNPNLEPEIENDEAVLIVSGLKLTQGDLDCVLKPRCFSES